MKRTAVCRLLPLAVFVIALEALHAAPVAAQGRQHGRGIRIAPIETTPEGQTYGRWAAEWWQWALGIPAAVNPLPDVTGEHCAERQLGKVWFLVGSLDATPVARHCAIPAGTSLFFPLVNSFYGAFLTDPPETRTEAFLRAQVSCTEPVDLSVTIDGTEVEQPTRFFTGASGSLSPLFNVQLPPGNLFGVDESVLPELALSPSVEQGYYLFVLPLRPGTHVIRWTAARCGAEQSVRYDLTVM